jgi:hypothetical protein
MTPGKKKLILARRGGRPCDDKFNSRGYSQQNNAVRLLTMELIRRWM